MNILEEAHAVFDTEIEALKKTNNQLDETFEKILRAIVNCKGKTIITGIGKPGHIATKLAATFSSLGTPSFYLHPSEALHGDLGMVGKNDVIIVLSYSGESSEVVQILPAIRAIGAEIIGITSNPDSTLAHYANIIQILPRFKEACFLGLAPTSSTTAVLCYGDALAVVASKIRGFSDIDFGKLHPAGSLGKKLTLKVDDLMAKDSEIPIVKSGTYLMEAISEMSRKGLGIVSIVDQKNKLLGIITDGDLRRIIEKRVNIYEVSVDSVMITSPKTISKEMLAVDALYILKNNSINNFPVVDKNNTIVGIITLQQIVKAGIVI